MASYVSMLLAFASVAWATEPADDAPDPSWDDVEEVVVHAEDAALEDTRARTTLDAADLAEAAGEDLATTASRVAGVTTQPGTGATSKPILRGLNERRVLVLQDGIRLEGQKWGPDHAPEIDPFSAGSLGVVLGAAGVRYGPDALGGVLLVDPPALRSVPGVGGTAQLGLASNGVRPHAGLRLDWVPKQLDTFTLRAEFSGSAGGNLSTPTYVLGNTANQTLSGGVTAQARWRGGQARLRWAHHTQRAGVFYGIRLATPAEFRGQLEAGQPEGVERWGIDHTLDRPRQQASHDTMSAHVDLHGTWGRLALIYAFQRNVRQEFERARGSVTGPQYDFTLLTHTLDAAYTQPSVRVPLGEGSADWTGTLGLQGLMQDNVYRGLALLPNHRARQFGMFATQRLAFSRVDLELGGRFDHLNRAIWMLENDLEARLREDVLQDGDCDPTASAERARCPTAFTSGAVSLGALVHVVPQALDLKVDLSSASRFPNVDELYLLGSAPSLPVFGQGNGALGVETAWTAQATAVLRTPLLEAQVSGFGTLLNDHLYFAPALTEDGEPRLSVTARGTFPRFDTQAVDAVSYGTDASVGIAPYEAVGLNLMGALVRTFDRANPAFNLVGTPADRFTAEVVGRPRPSGSLVHAELATSLQGIARQGRVDPSADLAPAPDGTLLWHARLDTTWHLHPHDLHVGVTLHNLLNTAWRSYTSLTRYYADNPGRNVHVRATLDF